MKRFSLLSSLFLTLACSLSANPWTGNFDDAKERAISGKKDLLIYFSGSAWDARTKALEKDVLETDEFKGIAPGKFVLLNYDLPVKARQDPSAQPLIKMAERYGVRRLPAMVLADEKGRPYGSVAYQKRSTAELLKTLDTLHDKGVEFRKRLADAAGKKGEEKAKALITALQLVPKPSWREYYQAELDAIKAADKEGKTGFIAELEKEEAIMDERKSYQALFQGKKFDEVVKKASAEIAKTTGEDAQRFYMYQIQALATQKKYDEAKAAIEAMVKLDPESTHGSSKERYLKIVEQMKERDGRQAKALAAAKNKPKLARKASGPIVSKPVAVVSDVKILHDEVSSLEAQLKKAAAEKVAKEKAKNERVSKIAALEKQIAELKISGPKFEEEAKKAAEAHAKLEKKLAAMKDVVKTHEEMEARKKKAAELEKQAKDLEKKASELKKKAGDIKTGKK